MRSAIDIRTGRPFSRRDACKGLAAIIAAGCAPSIVLAAGRSAGSIGGLQRGLGARVGMMGGKGLPYDYEVDWIRSTGTQYIDAGFLPESGDSFVCEFSYDRSIGSVAQDCLLSSGVGDYQLILLSGIDSQGGPLEHGGFWFKYFSTGSASAFNFYPTFGVFYKVTVSGTGLAEIGDYSAVSSPGGIVNTNLFLLKRANNSNYFVGRLKSFVHQRGSVKIRDFIPVVKSGVAYMYDKCGSICPLTGTSLYANAGTGAFAWG